MVGANSTLSLSYLPHTDTQTPTPTDTPTLTLPTTLARSSVLSTFPPTTPVTQHTLTSTPLSSLSPSPTMDPEEASLLTASIAMSVVALLFALAMMILVVVMFYFLLRVRRDVQHLLRSGGVGVTKIENGSSVRAMARLEYSNNTTTEAETPVDRKPSPSPSPSPATTPQLTMPKLTTTPQDIPQSHPPPTEDDLHVPAGKSPTPRDGYSNVKLLNSFLPASLRTEENLEGRTLEPEEVEKIEREEQRYEEVMMRKKREEEAVLAVRKAAGSSGGREEEEDEYTNPVDAISEKPAVQTPKKEDPQKKFTLSPSKDGEHSPSSYTDVFDQLPSGKKAVVKQSEASVGGGGKTMDETSLVTEKKSEVKPRRVEVCGYEDIEDDVFIGARSAPCQDSPLSASTGNVMAGSPEEEGREEKRELSKRYSHPHSRREAGREMVEVNPHSRKPVTLSSSRRKPLKQEKKGGEEAVDGEREGGKEDEIKKAVSKSVESSPTDTSKPFNVSNESGCSSDYYAFVDMAGKSRYRAESDSMKKEGSGAPKHYTVKERPPEIVDGKLENVKA